MLSTALNIRMSWHSQGDDYGFVYHKNGEQYCFAVRQETRQVVLSLVGRLAANPDVDFDWHDAVNVTSAIRQTVPATPMLTEVIDDYERDEVRESIDDWTLLVMMLGISLLGWWGIWLVVRAVILK